MKKFIAVIAVIAAACCLGACKGKKEEQTFDQYQALNEMLGASYSQISLTVTDTFDENTSLKSEYTIKFSDSETTVQYSVERFAGLSLDDTSSDVKTTLTGTAVIKNGKVTGGEEVGITADMAKTGLTFKEEYFENITINGVSLKADVKNASAFLGSDIVCSDMKVEAKYLILFNTIEISYTKNGNKIEYKYVFTP